MKIRILYASVIQNWDQDRVAVLVLTLIQNKILINQSMIDNQLKSMTSIIKYSIDLLTHLLLINYSNIW